MLFAFKTLIPIIDVATKISIGDTTLHSGRSAHKNNFLGLPINSTMMLTSMGSGYQIFKK